MSAWRSRLLRDGPALGVLAFIVIAGLVLRLAHLDYGLPYVYNQDEGSHFTSRAVAMFGGDANPGYFQNPSAFTYLVHLALRFNYGGGWPFGNFDDVIQQFARDPSGIYVVARRLAAVLGVAGAVAVYAVGRRLWDRRTGLVAAAVVAFAFLPVTYSRIALTDVGTLVPVALALLFAVRIHETGSLRWCAAAGAAAGVAIGFKYTSGLVLLAPLVALALRPGLRHDGGVARGFTYPSGLVRLAPPVALARRPGRHHDGGARRAAALGVLAVLGVALVAFVVTTPYFFLNLEDARRQLGAQTTRASAEPKFGQTAGTGFTYYLGSLTWGFGWLALAAAAAGAVILARRDPARAAVLVIFPLALFVYLSLQERFFGRWLLPAYPALALLAGVAVATAAAWVRERAPRLELPAVAAATLLLVWQSAAADARSMAVLGNPDTREVAREWLIAHNKPGLRTIIEPAVPARYYRARQIKHSRPRFVGTFVQDVRKTRIEYGATLDPRVIDQYREQGYCTVVTMSLIEGRSVEAGDPESLAYYARLRRESQHVFSVTPYRADRKPQPFDFDLSYNYYSGAYRLPGPKVDVYRLDDCKQGYGGSGGAAPEVEA